LVIAIPAAETRGARLARRLTALRLEAWGIPYGTEAHGDLVLIVAELTANAVQHGHVPGRDFRLRVHATADGRTVGAGWASPHPLSCPCPLLVGRGPGAVPVRSGRAPLLPAVPEPRQGLGEQFAVAVLLQQ
jgi:hypothetical protein